MPQTKQDPIIAIKRNAEKALLNIPGVHAVGIGPKVVLGKHTSQLAIAVFVICKKSLNSLPPDQRIPGTIQGIPTDVVESPLPKSFVGVGDAQKYRPLQGGCQICCQVGDSLAKYGTLGAMVTIPTTMSADGPDYLLTNYHVVEGANDRKIYQPELPGCCEAEIAEVSQVCNSSANVDGAIAELTGAGGIYDIIGIGAPKDVYTVPFEELPYPVKKSGAATGVTSGEIAYLHLTGTRPDDGWAFEDQMLIESGNKFGDPGDSGSAVVDAQLRVVGLLWGGGGPNQSGKYLGDASPISAVVNELKIVFTASSESIQKTHASFAIRNREHLVQIISNELQHTAGGRFLVDFYNRFQKSLSDIVNNDRRMLLNWKRSGADRFMAQMFNSMQDHGARFPEAIDGIATSSVIEQMEAMFSATANGELRESWSKIKPILLGFAGKRWPEILKGCV